MADGWTRGIWRESTSLTNLGYATIALRLQFLPVFVSSLLCDHTGAYQTLAGILGGDRNFGRGRLGKLCVKPRLIAAFGRRARHGR